MMNCISGPEIYQRLAQNIQTAVREQDLAIQKLLAAFFSGSQILLEDYPGTGKTT
jgi:MoxR-like ATPase